VELVFLYLCLKDVNWTLHCIKLWTNFSYPILSIIWFRTTKI